MLLKRIKRQPTSSLTCFIFHQAPVLLLLTCCCKGIIFAGQIQVIGPSQAVTVMVGDDIILPCHLKPASDASAMTFEWARPDLNPRTLSPGDLHPGKYIYMISLSCSCLRVGEPVPSPGKSQISQE